MDCGGRGGVSEDRGARLLGFLLGALVGTDTDTELSVQTLLLKIRHSGVLGDGSVGSKHWLLPHDVSPLSSSRASDDLTETLMQEHAHIYYIFLYFKYYIYSKNQAEEYSSEDG